MDIKIESTFQNPLISRTELTGFAISSSVAPTTAELTAHLVESFGIKHVIVSNVKTGFGSKKTTFSAKLYKNDEVLRKVEKFHVLHKRFGVEKTKLPRRARKDLRKKKSKVWGSEKRNIKKEEKKQLRE